LDFSGIPLRVVRNSPKIKNAEAFSRFFIGVSTLFLVKMRNSHFQPLFIKYKKGTSLFPYAKKSPKRKTSDSGRMKKNSQCQKHQKEEKGAPKSAGVRKYISELPKEKRGSS